MKRHLGIGILLAAVLLAPGGCQQGPRTYKVTGTVSYDGRPVPDGGVIFHPADDTAPAHGTITDGRFELQAVQGSHRVEIRAAREAPELRSSMGPVFVDYIPDRYNSQSKLTREVVPGAANHFDFALEADRK